MLYPFNYENKCRIYGICYPIWLRLAIYESYHFRNLIPLFLSGLYIPYSHSQTLSYHFSFFLGFNLDYLLGDLCSIQLSHMDISDHIRFMIIVQSKLNCNLLLNHIIGILVIQLNFLQYTLYILLYILKKIKP